MNAADKALAVVSAVGAVQSIALFLMYLLRSNWRATPTGVVLLMSFGLKAIIYLLLFVGRLVGGLNIWVWAAVVLAFDIVQTSWFVLVVKSQRAERRCREQDDPPQ